MTVNSTAFGKSNIYDQMKVIENDLISWTELHSAWIKMFYDFTILQLIAKRRYHLDSLVRIKLWGQWLCHFQLNTSNVVYAELANSLNVIFLFLRRKKYILHGVCIKPRDKAFHLERRQNTNVIGRAQQCTDVARI